MTIFDKVLESGIEFEHHESDLYIPVNDKTAILIREYEFTKNVTTFQCRISGDIWYDIPFAYNKYTEFLFIKRKQQGEL